MPYVSRQQEKWANATAGQPGGMTVAQVNEFNQASKGVPLPRTAHHPETGRFRPHPAAHVLARRGK